MTIGRIRGAGLSRFAGKTARNSDDLAGLSRQSSGAWRSAMTVFLYST